MPSADTISHASPAESVQILPARKLLYDPKDASGETGS